MDSRFNNGSDEIDLDRSERQIVDRQISSQEPSPRLEHLVEMKIQTSWFSRLRKKQSSTQVRPLAFAPTRVSDLPSFDIIPDDLSSLPEARRRRYYGDVFDNDIEKSQPIHNSKPQGSLMYGIVVPFSIIIAFAFLLAGFFKVTGLPSSCPVQPKPYERYKREAATLYRDASDQLEEFQDYCTSVRDYMLGNISYILYINFGAAAFIVAAVDYSGRTRRVATSLAIVFLTYSLVMHYINGAYYQDDWQVYRGRIIKTSAIAFMLGIVGPLTAKMTNNWLPFKTLMVLFGSCMTLAAFLFFVLPQQLILKFANVHEMAEDHQLIASHHLVVFMKALRYSLFIFTFDEDNIGIYILNLTFSTMSEVISRTRLQEYSVVAVKRYYQRIQNQGLSQWPQARNPFLKLHAGSRCLVSYFPLIVLMMIRITNWIPTPSRGNHLNNEGAADLSFILPVWVYLAFFLSEGIADLLSVALLKWQHWDEIQIGKHTFWYGFWSIFFNYAVICHIFAGAATSFELFHFRKFQG
mmetsp:Transcript_34085/g.38724  ORF Transcript_34085/g.38724 Transcript_34085/m.38724 type:complete len:522 (-) Transcript_34085:197-1762(-)